MRRIHVPFFLLCLLACAMVAWSAHNNVGLIRVKAQQEQAELDRFHRWLAAYSSLAPVRQVWDEAFVSGSQIKDLLTLYQKVNLKSVGLEADPDKLVLSRIEPIRANNRYLGLNEVCMATSDGNGGFSVTAKDYGKLIEGIQALGERRDLRYSSVTLDNQHNKPHATLMDFCLLARDDDNDMMQGGQTVPGGQRVQGGQTVPGGQR